MKKKQWEVLYLKPDHWQFNFYTGKAMWGGEARKINEEEYNQIQTNCPDDFAILEAPEPDNLDDILIPVETILKPIEEKGKYKKSKKKGGDKK